MATECAVKEENIICDAMPEFKVTYDSFLITAPLLITLLFSKNFIFVLIQFFYEKRLIQLIGCIVYFCLALFFTYITYIMAIDFLRSTH